MSISRVRITKSPAVGCVVPGPVSGERYGHPDTSCSLVCGRSPCSTWDNGGSPGSGSSPCPIHPSIPRRSRRYQPTPLSRRRRAAFFARRPARLALRHSRVARLYLRQSATVSTAHFHLVGTSIRAMRSASVESRTSAAQNRQRSRSAVGFPIGLCPTTTYATPETGSRRFLFRRLSWLAPRHHPGFPCLEAGRGGSGRLSSTPSRWPHPVPFHA